MSIFILLVFFLNAVVSQENIKILFPANLNYKGFESTPSGKRYAQMQKMASALAHVGYTIKTDLPTDHDASKEKLVAQFKTNNAFLCNRSRWEKLKGCLLRGWVNLLILGCLYGIGFGLAYYCNSPKLRLVLALAIVIKMVWFYGYNGLFPCQYEFYLRKILGFNNDRGLSLADCLALYFLVCHKQNILYENVITTLKYEYDAVKSNQYAILFPFMNFSSQKLFKSQNFLDWRLAQLDYIKVFYHEANGFLCYPATAELVYNKDINKVWNESLKKVSSKSKGILYCDTHKNDQALHTIWNFAVEQHIPITIIPTWDNPLDDQTYQKMYTCYAQLPQLVSVQ